MNYASQSNMRFVKFAASAFLGRPTGWRGIRSTDTCRALPDTNLGRCNELRLAYIRWTENPVIPKEHIMSSGSPAADLESVASTHNGGNFSLSEFFRTEAI